MSDMATPYHPTHTELGGTAFLFDPAVGPIRKGDGTSKSGSIGVIGHADPDLASALNAVYFTDVERWPGYNAGSAVQPPLAEFLVDSPEAHIVVNRIGLTAGFLGALADPLTSTNEPEFDLAQGDLHLFGAVEFGAANQAAGTPKVLAEQAGTHIIGLAQGRGPVAFTGGTIPYLDPMSASDPQLILAVNYLLDNNKGI